MSGLLSKVSLVIPVHNEEKRLPALFSNLKLGRFGQVIFVLDGCTDSSKKLLPRKAETVVLNERRGKGFALRAGFCLARKEIVCFVDADGTFDQGQVEAVCDACGSGKGLAIAERKVFPGKRAFKRACLRLVSRCLFGLRFRDTQCGLVAGTRAALGKVVPRCKSAGYEFPVELLWRAKLAGVPISTVGVEIPEEDYSNSTFNEFLDPLKMLLSLLKVRLLG